LVNGCGFILVQEEGQLDINGENIDTKGLETTDASVSLNLSKELSVKKGTALLIDTSCLHRAKPCFGSRYTLCSYYSN